MGLAIVVPRERKEPEGESRSADLDYQVAAMIQGELVGNYWQENKDKDNKNTDVKVLHSTRPDPEYVARFVRGRTGALKIPLPDQDGMILSHLEKVQEEFSRVLGASKLVVLVEENPDVLQEILKEYGKRVGRKYDSITFSPGDVVVIDASGALEYLVKG